MTTRTSLQNIVRACTILGSLATVSASSSNVRVLTDADFDQATSQGSWLFEFYAPWYVRVDRPVDDVGGHIAHASL